MLKTIGELGASDGNFTILLELVEMAGLTEFFFDPTVDITLFAPTNEAFSNLPDGMLDLLKDESSSEYLLYTLTHHVVDDVIPSFLVYEGMTLTMLNNRTNVILLEPTAKISYANIVDPDGLAVNG